jgi:tetratricopeptide (TPR) repeat protein
MNSPFSIQNIAPLARILRQEGFRFIIVSQNHTNIARDTTAYLQEKLPNRPIITIPFYGKPYNEITAEIVAVGNAHASPIVIIPDFGLLFNDENAEINAAFNQRRDYYGSMNIAFVCFLFTDAAQLVRKRLPDWWSVRSYVLDLEIEIPKSIETPRSLDMLDVTFDTETTKQKKEEIERLLYQITLATPENTNLINNLYIQLADLYYKIYDLDKALTAYTFLLNKPENTNNEILHAELYNNIGLIYNAQGDYNTALDYYKKALTIREKVLGTEHPDTATSYNNIANTYKAQGDYDTALEYYKQVLTIREKVLGTEHPDTATSYNNIGQIYHVQGNYNTALDYYKKALIIYEKVLGTPHLSTAITYNNVAGIYRSKGNYDTALDYHKKDLAICEKVLGTAHPSTATSYNNIANLYGIKSDYYTALNYYKKALIVFKKTLTLQHPSTKLVFKNYITALQKAQSTLHPATYQAHEAFIQSEFPEYLD